MIRQFGSLWRSKQRPAVLAAGVTLGMALVIGLGVLGWSNLRLRDASMALQAEQQAGADAAIVTGELALLRTELPGRESRARALRASGFLSSTDRVGWAESIAAVARELRPLAYTAAVGTPQWLPLPEAEATWYTTRALQVPSLHATDLVLQAEGLHEGELQRLLDTAVAAGGGVTRIEHCELVRRPDDVGVDAECTLRRFGLGFPDPGVVVGDGGEMENPS